MKKLFVFGFVLMISMGCGMEVGNDAGPFVMAPDTQGTMSGYLVNEEPFRIEVDDVLLLETIGAERVEFHGTLPEGKAIMIRLAFFDGLRIYEMPPGVYTYGQGEQVVSIVCTGMERYNWGYDTSAREATVTIRDEDGIRFIDYDLSFQGGEDSNGRLMGTAKLPQ